MTSGKGLFARLAKTRQSLASGLFSVFGEKPEFDDSIYEEIEDQLLMADLGVQTSTLILTKLRERAASQKIKSRSELLSCLRQVLVEIMTRDDCPKEIEHANPKVTLMVGVNGVGKTTTVAKLAYRYQSDGESVMLAACDTFRAAAVEQLQTWGNRLGIPVIAQPHGSDSAAVAFDAYQAALARGITHLLVDTAGRQHTHGDLMEQLGKIKRVLTKANPQLPLEVLITVDAGNGQNVLSQVASFNDSVALTGICVTKLDGTAKGGVLIALAERFNLPIRYIGVGEGLEDLQIFDPETFVNALIPASEPD